MLEIESMSKFFGIGRRKDPDAEFERAAPYLAAFASRIAADDRQAVNVLRDLRERISRQHENCHQPRAVLYTKIAELCFDQGAIRHPSRRGVDELGACRQAMQSLTVEEQAVLLIVAVCQFEIHEAAKMLDTSEELARRSLAEARRNLRVRLAGAQPPA